MGSFASLKMTEGILSGPLNALADGGARATFAFGSSIQHQKRRVFLGAFLLQSLQVFFGLVEVGVEGNGLLEFLFGLVFVALFFQD